ncbi:formimidoylglutamase [Pseudoalteromonas luteoviolacea]|uniref:formimidoylglutamase n=1 Tax=Pseudoalteromonas luteoviolacea TaxID=43657 RepID=UPI001B37D1F6|nr:formimidoylglutamase [Pseudoalteromonas luteoviolacea]MBQ4813391.1 formimidoylglutamase [Pseudoalteromonas luteoviolacea]
MTVNNWIKIYNESNINEYTATRENETRFWQSLSFLQVQNEFSQALKDAAQFGIKYVLVAINEDIGPRGNCGNGGATDGWFAFLKRFLNLPCNQFLKPDNVLLLGEIITVDLQAKSEHIDNRTADGLEQLRALCEELDQRVSGVLQAIFDADLEPIVIGGGHNNSYGLLKALSHSKKVPCQAINFDPHADFRALEGRHSGNGFSYAHHEGYLDNYHVVGMHEQKNNDTIVSALTKAGFTYTSYQDILVSRQVSLTDAIKPALKRFDQSRPLGVEVDVDAISGMPVSAFTNCGFSVNDAEHFVYQSALQPNAKYLHLCEAAPANHPQSKQQGDIEAGQVLSGLVCSYLRAKQS